MVHNSIDIWDNYKYYGEGEDGFRPRLDTYILDGDKVRGSVLICPGGGYSFVAEREAEPIALQFNAAGFHAFILYYSTVPRRHPQPLLDVSRAMCIIRNNAQEWRVDSQKIAVCGFSAGGHLAASLGVHWEKSYLSDTLGIEKGKNKPNALILCYPVITSGEFTHAGSFKNLLGDQTDLLSEMSLELQVNDKVPPAFIWHTVKDTTVPVENSMLFAQALREKDIPFELHIYPEGGHGLSLATEETAVDDFGVRPRVATWLNLCINWLKGVVFED
jgi:acetyl esterase/lipase